MILLKVKIKYAFFLPCQFLCILGGGGEEEGGGGSRTKLLDKYVLVWQIARWKEMGHPAYNAYFFLMLLVYHASLFPKENRDGAYRVLDQRNGYLPKTTEGSMSIFFDAI